MSFLRRIKTIVFTHKWKTAAGVIAVLLIGGIVSSVLSPVQPVYVTEAAELGSIEQTVEAVGTIISERDLQLQFPTSGIVSQVFVKEGDIVRAGQRLASLRAGNLAADVASASARVQQAEADYQLKVEGSRPEDIAISEAEVASKRASLETAKTSFKTSEEALETSQAKLDTLKQEALTSLIGYVTNVGSTVSKELTTTQNSLSGVRDVYSNNDIIEAVIQYGSAEYDTLMGLIRNAESTVTATYSSGSPADYTQALAALDKTKVAINQAMTVTNRGFDLVGKLQQTTNFTESDRQAYKSDLITLRNTLQTSLNSVDAEMKTLRDASANFSTRISAEEAAVVSARGSMERAQADIATYEASLRISEAQLQLKKAPVRKSDLDSAAASVRQARAALARASADYANTTLTAPINGRITKVAVKPGEFTPVEAAVTMLGDSPFQVEMYVSEIDVPKLQTTQSGSVELDAFRGTNFQLRVSEVDTAATDRDGVPKYRVRLDFRYPHDELKIGMTGDARIVTGSVQNVVSVPLRAVLEADDGSSYVRILNEDGTIEERTVVTGLEGEGGNIEVKGVEEGETVIVLEKK